MADSFILQGSYNLVDNVTKGLKGIDDQVKKSSKIFDNAESKVNQFSKKMSSFGKDLAGLGTKMTGFVSVPLAGLGGGMVKLGADAQEAEQKFKAVFKGMTEETQKFVDSFSKEYGRYDADIQNMMSTTQLVAQNYGLTTNAGVELSKNLQQLTADVGAFNDRADSDVHERLLGALRGEGEASEVLGLSINQTTLEDYLRRKGIKKTIKELTEAEKMEYRYQMMVEQTADMQGYAKKEAGGLSAQIRELTAKAKEFGEQLGRKILPIVNDFLGFLIDLMEKFNGLDDDAQFLILALGGVAIIIPPILVGIGSLITSISLITGVMTAFSFSIFGATVPLWGLLLIIAGVIAIGVLLVQNWDWICEKAGQVWGSITGFFQEFDTFLTGIFQTDFTEAFGEFGNVLNGFFDFTEEIWNSIKQIFGGVIDFIAGLFTADWERCWNGVLNIFGGIFNMLSSYAKAPINAIIWLLNSAIDGINSLLSFDFPDFVNDLGIGDISMSIPKINYLWQGGVITSPTMINPNTVVGDAYKGQGSQAEAVIPLDRLFSEMNKMFGAGKEIILNVDGREFMRAIAPYQEELEKYSNSYAY